jgi:predicted Rossmann fold flavoprotein
MRIVALDGAAKPGVKILVAGGGRCNVTHDVVTEREYSGGSRNAVRSVLRRFGVEQTVAFFAERGVELKREETGKLFPTTDRAQTVLDALLGALRDAGVELRHPARVDRLARTDAGFVVGGDWGEISAARVVLATGGMALPRSGSDGGGYALARGLGHTITDHVWPALVPLKLEEGHPLRGLAGVSAPARLEVRSGTGKRLIGYTDDTLCTHFGLSGPGPMDISRHLTEARRRDEGAGLVACWLPAESPESVDTAVLGLGKRSVGRWLRERLPERLALAICDLAGVDAGTAASALTRDARRSLVRAVTSMELPVVGDRGFTHAETTAGGVPLGEIAVSSMSSKRCPGLFLCGEICDVDGRIGGYNFQWAWASGHIAGRAAAAGLVD